jgi:N-methylhydantoinase B
MVAINELLAWDQYFAVGGALRHIDFDPTPGTLNCANFPASVSTAPTQSMEISLYPAYNIISKMIYSDEGLRGDIMGIGGTSQWPTTIFRGIDQWGERYGYLLIDPIGGSIGAFAHGDGINTGGQARTPIGQLPNVEHNEQNFPMLVLYRKELPDSGGAGKYRGGLSAETCFIPHNTSHITQDTLSSGNATPTSTGMMGGFPSTTNAYNFIRESDILERFGERHMVEDYSEVTGRPEHLELRQENFDQHPADVYAVRWSGGGGFGDPMKRDPAKVQHDLLHRNITPEAARAIFGAVLSDDGKTVDVAATEKNRAAINADRVARLTNGIKALPPRDGALVLRATDNIDLREDADGAYWACVECAIPLGARETNYKDACLKDVRPISDSNPLIGDPELFIDDPIEFRLYCCPSCGSQIENEVAVASDPVLRDVTINP